MVAGIEQAEKNPLTAASSPWSNSSRLVAAEYVVEQQRFPISTSTRLPQLSRINGDKIHAQTPHGYTRKPFPGM
jgi:hypothetical protein